VRNADTFINVSIQEDPELKEAVIGQENVFCRGSCRRFQSNGKEHSENMNETRLERIVAISSIGICGASRGDSRNVICLFFCLICIIIVQRS
jgi:hypothetical protein